MERAALIFYLGLNNSQCADESFSVPLVYWSPLFQGKSNITFFKINFPSVPFPYYNLIYENLFRSKMPFSFSKLPISGVILIEPKIFPDDRGSFAELFKASEFKANGIPGTFVQVNHSKSQKNVLRGLHYQLQPKAQAKLISVIHGEIFDVVVDIRKGSPTYGKWAGQQLSAANKRMLYVPAGFAHDFCTLSDDTEIIYYCSEEYAPSLERNILWNDAAIGIKWPVSQPLLSPKDAGGKILKDADNNFDFTNPGA